MIELLPRVEVETPEWSVDTILAHPERYVIYAKGTLPGTAGCDLVHRLSPAVCGLTSGGSPAPRASPKDPARHKPLPPDPRVGYNPHSLQASGSVQPVLPGGPARVVAKPCYVGPGG
jgi:hypothetical protein